ncbi:hypothetical protein [Rhizobium leguminosarum]|uniref:hypothetical protein n=1 Tax=Rhizobium leguminosarum TaxID=384 RepID=UPI0021BBFDE9|nr:hypothetical protein [Rhizobium leguminosarum]
MAPKDVELDQATFVDLADDKSDLVYMRRQHDRHRRGRVVDGGEIAQDVGLGNFGELARILSEQAGSRLLVSAWGGASISAFENSTERARTSAHF